MMLPPIIILILLFFLVGLGFIYLAYYAFVKFGTSFKNNPFFVKFSVFILGLMGAGVVTWLNNPQLAYWLFGGLRVVAGSYLTFFFNFTIKGSYNLKIFRLERDIEKLEFERKGLAGKLRSNDPEFIEQLKDIDEILHQEKQRLEELKKEKVLLLSDMNVSRIKKRFYRYDSPLNTEDERVEKAKSDLENLKYENEALEELTKKKDKDI